MRVATLKKIFTLTPSGPPTSLKGLKKLSLSQAGKLLQDIFTFDDYEIAQTIGDGDDSFLVSKFGEKMIISYKHWAQERVELAEVKKLQGEIQSKKADAGLIITTGFFSEQAEMFTQKKTLVLMNGDILLNLVLSFSKADKRKSVSPPQSQKAPGYVESRSAEKTRSGKNEILDLVQSAKSLRETLGIPVDSLKKMVGCEFIAFFGLEESQRKLVSSKLGDMIDKDEVMLDISSESLAGYVAATGKALKIDNAEDKSELKKIDPKLQIDSWWYPTLPFKVKSVLIVPLALDKKLIGVMEIINKKDKQVFGESDLKLSKQNSSAMALAISKIRQEESVLGRSRRGANQEEKVHALAQAIHSVDNIDKILIEKKDDILEPFDATLVTIYMVDREKNEIFSKVKTGEGINQIRVPISPKSIAGYVAYLQKPLNIKNVYNEEELKNIHSELAFNNSWDEKTGFKTKSMLVVPLMYNKQFQGVLQLINKKNSEGFGKTDEKYAQIMADNLALGFKNMAREERVRNITQTIHSAAKLDTILLDLKPMLLRLFEADTLTLYAFDPAVNQIYSRIKNGDQVGDVRVPLNTESIAGTVATINKVLNIKDVYDQEELEKIHPDLKFNRSFDEENDYRTKSMLVYPLNHEGKLQGILQLINKKTEDSFGEIDEKYARMISETLALGFKNIFREEKIRAINQAIHSASNLDSILIDLKNYLLDLFEATLVTVYTVDEKTNEIYSKFKSGKMIQEIRVPINPKTIAGAVATLMQAVNVRDINDPKEVSCIHPTTRYDNTWDKKSGMELKTMLVHPLIFQGKLMGVLQLINKKDKEMFEPMDEKNAAIVSESLALALNNQKKYDQQVLSKYGFSTDQ